MYLLKTIKQCLKKHSFNKTLSIFMLSVTLGAGVIMPTPASAIPTNRMDLRAEIQILAMITDQINYFKNVLTNLDDLIGISQLKGLASEVQNAIASITSIKDEVEGAVEGAVGDFSNIIKTDLGNIDLASSLNLPDSGLGGIEGAVKDEIKSVLTDSLKGGDVKQAAVMLNDRAKIMLEEKLGLYKATQKDGTSSVLKAEGLKKKREALSKMSNSDKGKEAVKEALTIAKDAIPMSFAGMQESAAKIAVQSGINEANKKLFALNTADQTRTGIIGEITKILAPYTADVKTEASYRYPLNKLQEQSAKALEKTTELSSGGPSEALRTIASLSAVMVEEMGIQNQMMLSIADIMADDIKISAITAMTGIDNYAENVQNNIQKYIEVYERIGTK